MASSVAKNLIKKVNTDEQFSSIAKSLENLVNQNAGNLESGDKNRELIFNLAWLYKKWMIIKYILPLFVALIILTYIYYVFFYNSRIRWFNSSIMIYLEPELQFFSEKISNFIKIYHTNKQTLFNYDSNINENIYFFLNLNSKIIDTSFENIDNILGRFNIIYEKEETSDNYLLEISKFINSNFSWTKSETLKLTKDDEIFLKQFFDNIYKISEQQDSFNSFMENSSLMNFIDFHHMDLENLHDNKLFIKYGKFLPKGDLNFYVEDILSKFNYKESKVSLLKELINDNLELFEKSESHNSIDQHVNILFNTIIEIFRIVLYEYFSNTKDSLIEEELNIEKDLLNDCAEEIDEEEADIDDMDKLLKKSPEKLFPGNEDKQQEFIELTEVYQKIRIMKMFFNQNKEDGKKLLSYFEENYIYIEKLLFETFNNETHLQLFDSKNTQKILTNYQNIIDYTYIKTHINSIELAVNFTIHFILDDNILKEENLENLSDLYTSFNDLFVIENNYRKRLETYAKYRNPDVDELKKLYNDQLNWYFKYFLTQGIKDQWNSLFKGNLPPRYYWTLLWLRKSTPNIKQILKWIFNEGNDDEEEVEEEEEKPKMSSLEFDELNNEQRQIMLDIYFKNPEFTDERKNQFMEMSKQRQDAVIIHLKETGDFSVFDNPAVVDPEGEIEGEVEGEVETFIPKSNNSDLLFKNYKIIFTLYPIFKEFSQKERNSIVRFVKTLTKEQINQLIESMKTFEKMSNKERNIILNSFDSKFNMIKLWTKEKPSLQENFFGGGNPFGFIKKIINPIKDVIKFIIDIIKLGIKILVKVVKLITKPVEFIAFFVKLIIGVFLILLRLIMYLVKIKKGDKGIYILGEFLAFVLVLLFFTALNLSSYVLFTIYTSVVMALDITVFKGKLYPLFYWLIGASENSPRAWYLREGYHYGQDLCKSEKCGMQYQNRVNRMFLAYYACGDSYKPDRKTHGLLCSRKMIKEPGYCLQANINRVRENLSSGTMYIPGRFMPNIDYIESSKGNRRKIANEFKNMKYRFWNNCENTMEDYDSLTKNICRLYPEVIKESNHETIKALCYNAYCVNGKREPFCYKFTKEPVLSDTEISNKNISNNVITSIIYVVVLIYLCNGLMKRSYNTPLTTK